MQDTTTLNCSAHPATEELGPITNRAEGWLGLHLHSTIAYDPHGTALRLLQAQCWARDPQAYGKKHRRHQLPIQARGSVQWLRGYAAACAAAQACPPNHRGQCGRSGGGRAWVVPGSGLGWRGGSAWRTWSSAGNSRRRRSSPKAQCPAIADMGNSQGFGGVR